jgi:hypothetical protein
MGTSTGDDDRAVNATVSAPVLVEAGADNELASNLMVPSG